VRPEAAALASDSGSLPGVADVLAGEPASDEIHDATPRAAVEGRNITPDRSRSQGTILHARRQYRSRIGVPLHETDRVSAASLETEREAPAAGKQFDGT
jgi:hypothetical protein